MVSGRIGGRCHFFIFFLLSMEDVIFITCLLGFHFAIVKNKKKASSSFLFVLLKPYPLCELKCMMYIHELYYLQWDFGLSYSIFFVRLMWGSRHGAFVLSSWGHRRNHQTNHAGYQHRFCFPVCTSLNVQKPLGNICQFTCAIEALTLIHSPIEE